MIVLNDKKIGHHSEGDSIFESPKIDSQNRQNATRLKS